MQPTESLNHLIIIYLFIHLVCGRVHVVQVGLLILWSSLYGGMELQAYGTTLGRKFKFFPSLK